MHPILIDSLHRLQDHFEGDERVVALFLAGSLGRGNADEYSDIDAEIIVRQADYAAIKAELYGLCNELCGRVLVWLPEGENDHFVNYAFLFEAQGEVLLCDLGAMTDSLAAQHPPHGPYRVLFDRAGLLAAPAEAPAPPPFAAGQVSHAVDNYWVYMFLNGKYYRRGDLYKLLYVQDVLFHIHMGLLHAFCPERAWHWWALDVQDLSAEQREDMLVYFSVASPEAIARALAREVDLFSRDAQAACRQWGLEYPAALERGVRAHLQSMGVITA